MASADYKIPPLVVELHNSEEVVKLRQQLVSLSADYDKLDLKFQESKTRVIQLEGEITSLNEKFAKSDAGALTQQLEGFKSTAKTAVIEVQNFLKVANLLKSGDKIEDSQFREWATSVANGAKTANQAIAEIKITYGDLIGELSGSGVDASSLTSFVSALGGMQSEIREMAASVRTLIDGLGNGGGGVGGAVNSAAGGIGNLEAVISRIDEVAKSATPTVREMYAEISALARSFADLAGADKTSLFSLVQLFENLGGITARVSKETVANILSLATSLKSLNDAGISGSLKFDLTGLAGVKIPRASIEALAKYLPEIAEVKPEKLSGVAPSIQAVGNALSGLKGFGQKSLGALTEFLTKISTEVDLDRLKTLDGLKFDNLRNIQIDEGVVGRIQRLVDALKTLEDARVANTSVSGEAISVGMGAGVGGIDQQMAGITMRAGVAAFSIEHLGDVLAETGVKGDAISAITRDLGSLNFEITRIEHMDTEGGLLVGLRGVQTTEDGIQRAVRALRLYNVETGEVENANIRFTHSLQTAGQAATLAFRAQALDSKVVSWAQSNADAVQQYGDQLGALRERIAQVRSVEDLGRAKAEFDALTASAKITSQAVDEVAQKQLLATRADKLGENLSVLMSKNAAGARAYSEELAQLQARIKQISTPAELRQATADFELLSVRVRTASQEIEGYAKREQATFLSSANLRSQAAAALNNYSAAQNSSNAQSRSAYEALANAAKAAADARDAYNGTAESLHKIEVANQTLKVTMAESTAILRKNGDAAQSIFARLGAQFKKFSVYFGPMRIIMQTVRMVREMVKTSREMDLALGQMQIVTRESERAIAEFGRSALETAKKIGASVTDIVESATAYARLGYSSEESGTLAEYTAMLKNVADIDVEPAREAVTSIIKAFDIDTGSIESVMDKLVVTGNNFPISVAEIAEGMKNASSTLSAAGNSFEQSVALLTAANTTIQNASKASTGLRTIAARIRNTTTDLEELGEDMTQSKYDEIVKQLTGLDIALKDVNGEYRSTYDIMADIASKWKDMSSMQKAALATALSGTRQQAVFYSIIDQFQEAQGSLDAMLNGSGGALSTAYGTYLETTEAHIGRLKASFQELSTDVMQSSLMNFFVDLARGIVTFTDSLAKAVVLLPAFVTGLIGSIVAIKNAKSVMALEAETELMRSHAATVAASLRQEGADLDAINGKITAMSYKERELMDVEMQMMVTRGELTREQYEEYSLLFGLRDMESSRLAAYQAQVVSSAEAEARANLGNAASKRTLREETERLIISKLLSLQANGKITEEERKQMMADLALAGTHGILSGATDKLKNSTMGLWSAMGTGGKVMLAITAITTVVGIVTSVVRSFKSSAEAAEEASQKIEQLQGEMTQAASGFRQTAKSVSEITPKLVELSRGVDQFGHNISLTESQYEEFLSLNNQLAEMFPNLKIGMDSNGNAMLSLSYNADTLTGSLEALLEVERQAANQKIVDKIGDLYDNAVSSHNKYVDQKEGYLGIAEQIRGAVEAYNAMAEANPDIVKTGISTNAGEGFVPVWISNIEQAIAGSGNANLMAQFKAALSKYVAAAEKTGKFDLFGFLNDPIIKGIDASARKLFDGVQSQIDGSWGKVNSALAAWLETDPGFTSLDSEMRDIAQRMVGNLDLYELNKEGYDTAEKVEAYISTNIILPLKSASSSVKSEIKNLFSLDTDALSVSDYVDKINKAISAIASEINMSPDEVKKLLGFDSIIDSIESAKQDVFNALGPKDGAHTISSAWLNSLSVGDLRKVAEYARKYGASSVAALREALKDGTMDALEFNLDIGSEEESIKSLNEIIKESGDVSGVTADSIAKLQQRYQGLSADGYTVDDVFRRTADGIRVNRDAVDALEKAYVKSNSDKNTRKLQALGEQYEKLSEQIRDTKDSEEALQLIQKRDALAEEIKNTAILESNYRALTSAYGEWLSAKETTDPSDVIENIGKGYDEVLDLLNRGFYNKDEVNEYLDLVLGSDRIMDNVDAFNSLSEAISGTSYSITDFFKFNDDNKLTSEGIINFLDAVQEKLGKTYAIVGDDGEVWWDFSGDKMQEVADALGVSVELVQKFTEAARDSLGDTQIGDELDAILKDMQIFDSELSKEFSEVKKRIWETYGVQVDETANGTNNLLGQIKNLAGVLKREFSGEDGKIDFSADGAQEIIGVMGVLSNRMREINHPAEVKVKTAGLENANEEAYKLVTTINAGKDALAMYDMESALGNTDEANRKVQGVAQALQSLLGSLTDEQKHSLGLDTEEARAAIKALAETPLKPGVELDPEQRKAFEDALYGITGEGFRAIDVPVNFITDPNNPNAEEGEKSVDITVGNNEVQNFYDWLQNTPFKKDATIGCRWGAVYAAFDYIRNTPLKRDVEITVTRRVETVAGAQGTAYAKRLSSAQGTAFVWGNWGIVGSGTGLGGEVGPEILVRNGKWRLIGENGAEMFNYQPGDIVFNAEQTRQILRNGKIMNGKKRGVSYLGGSAFAGYTNTGKGNIKRDIIGSAIAGGKSSSSPSSSSSSSDSYSSSDVQQAAEDTVEAIDWIEIAISRVERAIDNLGKVASSAYRTLGKRLGASSSEISEVTREIDLQQKAYDRYIKQANSVGLSSGLAQLVRDGAIDIAKYDEDTRKLIDDYKEWYEKALACKDAVDDLHESLADLYKDRFDDIEKDFDNRLGLLEHQTNMYDASIEEMETSGYFVASKYYRLLKGTAEASVTVMQSKAASMRKALEEAMDSGEIEEYSEAWYDMVVAINEVDEATAEAATKAIEYARAIRQLKWDINEFRNDQVDRLAGENDFLVGLLETEKLFTETGKLTSQGLATLGAHTVSYNVYMNKALHYAGELRDVQADLAKDPNDKEAIETFNDLVDAQRDAIESALDERDAIKSLVEDGIEKELESVKKLIDAYEDELDRQKDIYEYQKKITDKTREVASIRKQLAAFSGDESDESRARIQKLQLSLRDAEDELREEEYDQYISDQKQILDDMYEEYEKVLNARLDDMSKLIEDVCDAINANADTVSGTIANIPVADDIMSIRDTLQDISKQFGYIMSPDQGVIWNAMGRAVVEAFTSASLSKALEANKELGDLNADGKITAAEARKVLRASAKLEQLTEEEMRRADLNKDGKITAAEARAILRASAKLDGLSAAPTTTVDTVKGIRDSVTSIADSTSHMATTADRLLEKGVTGAPKFASGGLADFTGLAHLDGSKQHPELVLNPQDTQNFIALRDGLRQIVSGAVFSPIDNLSANMYAFRKISDRMPSGVSNSFGNININIDHVEDYDDFVTKLQSDRNFERMIQAMTVDRAVGGGALNKYRYSW